MTFLVPGPLKVVSASYSFLSADPHGTKELPGTSLILPRAS